MREGSNHLADAVHDEPLTPEQIENWRRVMPHLAGATDLEIQIHRDQMQQYLNDHEFKDEVKEQSS